MAGRIGCWPLIFGSWLLLFEESEMSLSRGSQFAVSRLTCEDKRLALEEGAFMSIRIASELAFDEAAVASSPNVGDDGGGYPS
jgi:hypothetical protein